jgi:hypothetical protein
VSRPCEREALLKSDKPCKYRSYQSKSQKRPNPCWRKKSVLLARVARNRLVLLDGLKNWIATRKCLNCVSRG